MTRDQTRAAMPLCTEIIDSFRSEFGPPVALVAVENDCRVEWKAELLSDWKLSRLNKESEHG